MQAANYKTCVPNELGKFKVVPEQNAYMSYVDMGYIRLKKGEQIQVGSDEREIGVLLMGGDFTVIYNGSEKRSIHGRKDPFSGLPHAVYIPAGKQVTILADSDFEAATYGSLAKPIGEVGFIYPEDITVLEIGENEWYINGYFVIGSEYPAQRLIIGETQIPVGHWCSVPCHSHDKDIPGIESKLEEIYLFKFNPGQGFGFQGLYTDDRELDDAYIIRNNDVIMVPRGYHPNVAGPGYEMRMFWGMAGESRYWTPYEDPDHKWIGKNSTSPGDCEW